jgi:hypothetical protein
MFLFSVPQKFSSSIPFVSTAAVRTHGVDLSAGKELVDSYTKSLGAIHRNGLINAEKARLSFRTLTACATHCATIESEWNSLVAQFEELPSVSNNIININKRISSYTVIPLRFAARNLTLDDLQPLPVKPSISLKQHSPRKWNRQ